MQNADLSEGAKLYAPRSRHLMKDGVWLVEPEQRPAAIAASIVAPYAAPKRFTQTSAALFPWHAVQVGSKCEARVSDDLRRRRIEQYLPTYQEQRNWNNGQRKTLDIPLFRGYVFARIENDPESRTDVLSISGATRIVGAVTEQEIENVRKMLDAGGKPYLSQNPLLKIGCKVRVRSGSLKGTEGIFLRQKGHGRLILSIDMIRQGVSVEIDAADVEVLA